MAMEKDKMKPLTLAELTEAATKRVSLISQEFSRGFEFLINYPKSVTIFGSTQTKTEDKYYKLAESVSARIVKELHYSIVTGGGPGIMEAANKGAFEAGGNSLGLTIELPNIQITNKYLTDTIRFHYFFCRKVCLAFSAEAYLFFPGGFGTLDEFTEILTLVQTRKIEQVPIILVGKEYWQPLIEFFKERILAEKKIEPAELELFKITDDEEEIMKIIKEAPIYFGIRYKGISKPDDAAADIITEGTLSHLRENI